MNCANCGEENPARARFCLNCGTSLAEPGLVAEERKVVSVLFADLVGFTARSERSDPEDVRAMLRPYHARLKYEIERFEGTVEKFIGDAVMGVFGAPVSHEDDAERAVRAALAIQEAIAELNEANPGLELAVRGAVNTGEAVVTLGARPELGEGMVTGDVVNTASRLQGSAPVGTVVVGEVTYRATKDFIDYTPLPPVSVKGKADPVPIWLASGAKSRFGVDVQPAGASPLIGRQDELELLKRTYARTLREASIQLVTITGEPGVGKSRLVTEFSLFVDEQPELIYWRQGRCLPYGEGITFWALGEIVKAHAGILESDDSARADAKLTAALEPLVHEIPDREWLRGRLAPLVGVSVEGTPAERAESFTAWRRFLESLAARGPTVVVFEDLQWADPALLEFVEHLVDYSTGVPMLVLCATRPDLYDRRPGWGGGKRNSTTLSLAPLTQPETDRLIASLLSNAILPDAVHESLLERSGGNPLYAEEFVRMLMDRGIVEHRNGDLRMKEGAEIPVPDTVQALIAARLDAVPAERKALLQDAAVVGKVFWSGAVSSMGRVEEATIREGLHELSRRELVRPSRTSSVRDQAEYSFWHVLVRDIAYSQIPRAARAAKHRSAAAWIEGIAGERVADHAEVLAHHYLQALELARAAGAGAEAQGALGPARRFLELAGDRALRLGVGTGDSYYRRALELAPSGDSSRGRILAKAAQAAYRAGRLVESTESSQAAAELLRDTGEITAAGRAMLVLAMATRDRGETARSNTVLAEAVQLLEPLGPGPELAEAYVLTMRDGMLTGDLEKSMEFSKKALPVARELGLDGLVSRALQYRGISRHELGDRGGMDDVREALRLSLEQGLGWEAGFAYNNLGDQLAFEEGPTRGLDVLAEGIRYTEGRGLTFDTVWMRGSSIWMLYDSGQWDEAMKLADQLLEWDRAAGGTQVGVFALTCTALVHLQRGSMETSASRMDECLDRAREARDPQAVGPALITQALVEHARGSPAGAVKLLDEYAEVTGGRRGPWGSYRMLDAVRLCISMGAVDRARSIMTNMDLATVRQEHMSLAGSALLMEADGDLEQAAVAHGRAADVWAAFGDVPESGHARLGRGRCLLQDGHDQEAKGPLLEARRVFERLRARQYLTEADMLLERASGRQSDPAAETH